MYQQHHLQESRRRRTSPSTSLASLTSASTWSGGSRNLHFLSITSICLFTSIWDIALYERSSNTLSKRLEKTVSIFSQFPSAFDKTVFYSMLQRIYCICVDKYCWCIVNIIFHIHRLANLAISSITHSRCDFNSCPLHENYFHVKWHSLRLIFAKISFRKYIFTEIFNKKKATYGI